MPPTPVRRFDPALSLALLVIACVQPLGAALAQQSNAPPPAAQPAPPSRDIPRPDQLEPGVDTSPALPAASGTPSSAAPAAAVAPAARSANTAPAAAAPAPKASAASKAAAAASKALPASGPPVRKGPDRLQLDATEITGNRELPKVLYIVPWKRSDLGDLVGRPVNSLLDEVLQPLDRDVFQRENRYYDALKPDAGTAKAPAAQGPESKP
jgi:hypothetical protein